MAAQNVVLQVMLCAQLIAIMVVYVALMRRCVRAGFGREVAVSVAVGAPLAVAIFILGVAP
jgi:hypothetical protein